ncbi:hypothetical protein JL720_2657 [Aureococcus anophagefferens]|nr:hypothetical protein JL720_2657 [Aureococcus anophagefferens]
MFASTAPLTPGMESSRAPGAGLELDAGDVDWSDSQARPSAAALWEHVEEKLAELAALTSAREAGALRRVLAAAPETALEAVEGALARARDLDALASFAVDRVVEREKIVVRVVEGEAPGDESGEKARLLALVASLESALRDARKGGGGERGGAPGPGDLPLADLEAALRDATRKCLEGAATSASSSRWARRSRGTRSGARRSRASARPGTPRTLAAPRRCGACGP